MSKVAIVTGGSSGMGEATVRELKKRGWNVAPMARSKVEFQGDVALDTMSLSLARALGPDIRVNVVAPGYVRTPWQVGAHGAEGAADLERRYAERAPLKAAPQPQHVAEAIAWMVEGARLVTGEILHVDGGMHIASPR